MPSAIRSWASAPASSGWGSASWPACPCCQDDRILGIIYVDSPGPAPASPSSTSRSSRPSPSTPPSSSPASGWTGGSPTCPAAAVEHDARRSRSCSSGSGRVAHRAAARRPAPVPRTAGALKRVGDHPPLQDTETGVDLARRLAPGTLVAGRYRMVATAGIGGMGVVYRAHDEELDVDVALKVLRPDLGADPDWIERFRRELVLARQVTHRNVVRIHDIGESDGLRFLTMRYVEGRSLLEVLDKDGPLPVERAVRIVRQVAEALQQAHDAGIVHRDLKPGNILARGGRHRLHHRLRRRPLARPRRADPDGRGGGHARLPVPGAGRGRSGRRPQRHLRARHPLLRDAHRRAPVPRRVAGGDPRPAHRRARARHRRDGRRACRRTCAPRSRAASSAAPRADTRPRASSSPTSTGSERPALRGPRRRLWLAAARGRASPWPRPGARYAIAPPAPARRPRPPPCPRRRRHAVAVLPLADETADPGPRLDGHRHRRDARRRPLGEPGPAGPRRAARLPDAARPEAGRAATTSARCGGSRSCSRSTAWSREASAARERPVRVDLRLVSVDRAGALTTRHLGAESADEGGLFRLVDGLGERLRRELGRRAARAGGRGAGGDDLAGRGQGLPGRPGAAAAGRLRRRGARPRAGGRGRPRLRGRAGAAQPRPTRTSATRTRPWPPRSARPRPPAAGETRLRIPGPRAAGAAPRRAGRGREELRRAGRALPQRHGDPARPRRRPGRAGRHGQGRRRPSQKAIAARPERSARLVPAGQEHDPDGRRRPGRQRLSRPRPRPARPAAQRAGAGRRR